MTQSRDVTLVVVSAREPAPTATPRPAAPRAPLLVVGAPGSGVGLAAELAAAFGWMDHTPDLRRLYDELFASLTWSWDHPPTVELVQAASDRFRPALQGFVTRLLGGSRPPVAGDPRTALVLAWWCALLPAQTRFVLAVRDPLAVARSLQRRDGVPLRRGLAWWEHQWTLALGALHGRPCHVLSFEAAIADPQRAQAFACGLLDAGADDGAALLPALRAVVRADASVAPAPAALLDTYLTLRQRELWSFLSILPARIDRLDVPSQLRAPSPGALSALLERDPAPAPRATDASPAAVAAPEVAELTARLADAERDAAALGARIAALDERRRGAEAEAAELRHRLQVAVYEQSNLRATLTRIETARQTLREQLGTATARLADAEVRAVRADAERARAAEARAALEGTRSWRLAQALARLARRLRGGGGG